MTDATRRRFLQLLAGASAAGLAGCSATAPKSRPAADLGPVEVPVDHFPPPPAQVDSALQVARAGYWHTLSDQVQAVDVAFARQGFDLDAFEVVPTPGTEEPMEIEIDYLRRPGLIAPRPDVEVGKIDRFRVGFGREGEGLEFRAEVLELEIDDLVEDEIQVHASDGFSQAWKVFTAPDLAPQTIRLRLLGTPIWTPPTA